LYKCCKEFGHLARNCKNKREGGEETIAPQNKFEILRSKVMQYGVEKKIIRRQKTVVVECFKCGEKEHKYRECLLWERRERVVHMVKSQKAHQQEELVHPAKEKVQKGERRLRRKEKEEVVCMAKPQEVQ